MYQKKAKKFVGKTWELLAESKSLTTPGLKIPKKLYKYKKLDQYAFDMINRDYLYIAAQNELDDPFELNSLYSFAKLKYFYEKSYLNNVLVTLMNLSKEHLNNSKAKKIEQVYEKIRSNPSCKESLAAFAHVCSNALKLDNEASSKLHNNLINFQKYTLDKETTHLFLAQASIPFLIQNFGICSLSETNTSLPMWALYADNYRGCCLEYSLVDFSFKTAGLFPVIYSNKRTNDVNKLLEETLVNIFFLNSGITFLPFELNALFSNLYLTKSPEWSHQKEWRLISGRSDEQREIALNKIGFRLKNVYIGFRKAKEQRLSPELYWLQKLSIEKGFGLYVASPNQISLNLEIKPLKNG